MFGIDFLSNWVSNIASTSKNAFRYTKLVKDFATCIYILGGISLYESVRLNIPGSAPNLTSKNRFIEGEFQYSSFPELVQPLGYCGEDRTDSFDELESWHDQAEMSSLLKIHVIQALTLLDQIRLSPFLLAAYGTNGKYKAHDVLSRWSQNVRILGVCEILLHEHAQTHTHLYSVTQDDIYTNKRWKKTLRIIVESSMQIKRGEQVKSNDKTTFLNHPDLFSISSLQVNEPQVSIQDVMPTGSPISIPQHE